MFSQIEIQNFNITDGLSLSYKYTGKRTIGFLPSVLSVQTGFDYESNRID